MKCRKKKGMERDRYNKQEEKENCMLIMVRKKIGLWSKEF